MKNRGVAYILVIYATLMCFIFAAAAFYLISNNAYLSRSVAVTVNDYEMAVSGVYYALDLLNARVSQNKKAINESVLSNILSRPIDQISKYNAPAEGDFTNGYFSLVNPAANGKGLYGALFAEKAAGVLAADIVNPAVMTMTNGKGSYTVTVTITPSADFEFYIVSKAVNPAANSTVSVSAYAFFPRCDGETFEEDYAYDTSGLGFASIAEKREYLHGIGAIDFPDAALNLRGFTIKQIYLQDADMLALKNLRKL